MSTLSALVLRAFVMMYRIREGVREVDYAILTKATAVVLMCGFELCRCASA